MKDPGKVGPAIGIDLGTWKCCVGVVRDGKVQIIENERGCKTTPSYVAFTETERLVGEDAKLQVAVNWANTVSGVKRIIGRSSDDPSLQDDVKTVFPFTVRYVNEKPVIEVNYRNKMIQLFPEQVSAMLLSKMKRIAESHLGCEVRDAVISVPAYFNNAQRQATKDAGAIAGLNVLGLINEPTAAALAYRDNKGPTDEIICVVDLGGGTLDVSVIQLGRDGCVQVKKVSGTTSFGGIDFDICLVRHFLAEYARNTRQNINESKKAVLRLQMACEKLKHTLTHIRSEQIHIDCLVNDTNFESSLTKEKFNSITADLDKRLITVISHILHDVEPQIQLQAISRVVLIGGSTRIPNIQQVLERAFKGKKLDQSVNPDEAIAHGAAIYASELMLGDSLVQEVCPHVISLNTEDGLELPLLAANSLISKKKYLSLDNPKLSSGKLFFTERQHLQETTDLGVVDVPEKERAKFGLAYGLDKDGFFVAELVKRCNDQLLYDRGSVDHMKEEEKKFEKYDMEEKERLKALNFVEAFCSRNKTQARNMREEPNLREACEAFMRDCDDAMNWVDGHPGATKADCKEKIRKLDVKFKVLSSLVSKGNYPADYLRYEGHPYLLDEASSDESPTEVFKDRKPERKPTKGKNKFYSAPTKREKRRPSLSAMEGPGQSAKATDSEYPVEEEDSWNKVPQKGKKTRKSSSKAKSWSKFNSVPSRKRKTRPSVNGHFTSYDREEDSSEGDASIEMNRPPSGNKYPSKIRKKSKCNLM